jgi:hypothetical protein
MSMGLAWKNYDQQLRMKKIARPFHVMGKCGIKWRERISVVKYRQILKCRPADLNNKYIGNYKNTDLPT